MAGRRRGRPRKKKLKVNTEEAGIVFAIVFMMAAGITLVSLFINAPYFIYIHRYLGWGTPIAIVFLSLASLRLFGYKTKFTSFRLLIGQLIAFLSLDAFLHTFLPYDEAPALAQKGDYGGMIGYWISEFVIDRISRLGALFFFTPLLIVSLAIGSGLTLMQVRDVIKQIINFLAEAFAKLGGFMRKLFAKKEELQEEPGSKMNNGNSQNSNNEKKKRMVGELSGRTKVEVSGKINKIDKKNTMPIMSGDVQVVSDYKNWKLPPVDLLNPPQKIEDTKEDLNRNSNIIEQTLDSFGVQARVADIASGPTVTQYALDIAMGTKVSRIKNLAGDLALALAAPSGAVRIEAPIPGTSLVGVEVPNSRPRLVTIREIIDSSEMDSSKLRLGLSLGRSVSGKIEVIDLQKMPHLLLAGSTGSGKSVLINAFLLSVLMKKSPADLRLILVDPKMVELSLYNSIPHLLTPVITEMDKVINSLKWALAEMQRRYTLFKQSRVRNMQEFNSLDIEEHLPYILIVMDEIADLMMTAGIEVESSICRLAQMARATGIHLVLATQRPSVNVLTGLIKANVPARVGMSVATSIDSRVILDQIGAETLLGNGDMLYKAPDKNRTYRIQGPLVENAEIERVIDYIKKQSGGNVAYEETVVVAHDGENGAGSGYEGEDELFKDAVRVICAEGKASSSLLQRRMRIGYNRAARLIDELEAKGAIGPANGSKPREVLIGDAEGFLSGPKDEEQPI